MRTHYIDFEILPDPEFSQVFLLGALYSKVHRALVQMAATGIGVSFPQYSLQPRGLGRIMRLHGSEDDLSALLAIDWLRGMRDHVFSTGAVAVPAVAEHRRMERRQYKTNVDRLRRRRMRRRGEDYYQAAVAIPDGVEEHPKLPYIQLRSSSTGQSFCLFLSLSEPESQVIDGTFNSYGLSRTATVPWF